MRARAQMTKEHDLIVLSDEPYEDILIDSHHHVSIGSFDGMAERTISAFTLSKSYAMTGWRVGYTVAPAAVIDIFIFWALVVGFGQIPRQGTSGGPCAGKHFRQSGRRICPAFFCRRRRTAKGGYRPHPARRGSIENIICYCFIPNSKNKGVENEKFKIRFPYFNLY